MELELDLVPLLDKKPMVIQPKGFFTDNYKPAGYGCLPEKLYLARRIPGLMTSIKVRKLIREYMIQAESKLDYEIALHYQTKIVLLQEKIHELTSQKKRCSDIKIGVNDCIEGVYGAAVGGCCGAMGGMGLECLALGIKAYVWLWCDPHHNPIVCDALLWGCPICTGTGCVVGTCIGASGLYDKIEWV
jgi:hypothetical protein